VPRTDGQVAREEVSRASTTRSAVKTQNPPSVKIASLPLGFMSRKVNRPQVIQKSGDHLDAVAFVKASSHRSSVMLSFLDWPKTTGQVAFTCDMSAPHASRAIHELVARGLVESATPEVKGRGRLYRITREGDRICEAFNWDTSRLRTPVVRGTPERAWYAALVDRFGKGRADAMMRDLHQASIVEAPSRRWIPLRSQMRLLEEIERRFGDGSFRLVQDLARDSVRYYSSVRRYLLRALPFRVVLDMGASAYLREFNHGRIEVDVLGTQARARHFDWLSSPARCAAWLGSWEGLLRMRNLQGDVEKQACMLKGTEFCSYLLKWRE